MGAVIENAPPRYLGGSPDKSVSRRVAYSSVLGTRLKRVEAMVTPFMRAIRMTVSGSIQDTRSNRQEPALYQAEIATAGPSTQSEARHLPESRHFFYPYDLMNLAVL
jgi:hypothetical protein